MQTTENKKQITVFGASGRVGRLVVAELISRGYTVVAFVRNGDTFIETHELKIVQGDIYNAEDVKRALAGSTAVISTLGSWGSPMKNILTVGMKHIIPAMRALGVTTIISLTGADARASGDELGLVHRLTRPILNVVMGKIMADAERHLKLLEQSNLDWTVIRSPVMSKRNPHHDRYKLDVRRPFPWQTVPYRLVALSLVNSLQDRTWSQESPYISWRPW